MEEKVVVIYQDGPNYFGINMLEKSKIKGRILEMYLDKNDVDVKLSAGDLYISKVLQDIFHDEVLDYKICDFQEKISNLKDAYFHYLDCVDAKSYTLENNQMLINGKNFIDIHIFLVAEEILKATQKILKLEKKKGGVLPQKFDLNKIDDILKDWYKQSIKVTGYEMDYLEGYSQQNVNSVICNIRKEYNLQNYDEDFILNFIHKVTMEYLKNMGEIFFNTNLENR